MQHSKAVLLLTLVLLWFLLKPNSNPTRRNDDSSNVSIAYFPQLVRIPDSVHTLSESITKKNHPTEVTDLNFTILTVRVSRLRSGGSAIFVVRKQQQPLQSNFWCLFDDQSITPVYTYHVLKSETYIPFLECSLPESIIRRVWYNRTVDQEIPIYLSTSRRILSQASLNIPWSRWTEENEQAITLCTVTSDIAPSYFIQWIEFHRLVGISKFVIYNVSNMNNHFSSIIDSYEEEYPALIDIIPWNHSFDEIQYDCFIRYGDISEWIVSIDITEYLIPKMPFETLPKLLNELYGRNLQVPVLLENLQFCSHFPSDLSDKDVILRQHTSRYTVSNRSMQYLYRPRSMDYLSINRCTNERSLHDQMSPMIALARYPVRPYEQLFSSCLWNDFVEDTSIRDRFSKLI